MSEIGNKAKNLKILKDSGFKVPEFIVISVEDKGDGEKIVDKLRFFIKEGRRYAVRSSGTLEDTNSLSFAGQYYTELNVKGQKNIVKAIKKCFDSTSSPTVEAYIKKNDISFNELGMAVVVQEMVYPDYSGVAFSVNPLSGIDKEIVINVAKGLGDVVVSGKASSEEYIYNWYDEQIIKKGNLLSEEILLELSEKILDIQVLFGHPVDVEFAIKDGKIYFLQSRAITKILYEKIPEEWTTADFKDGGVSATVCRPFMWSLYEYIWEISYRKFLNEDMFLNKNKLNKLGDMFFGRPYWNLSNAKLAMSKVPGYKEREFDEDLGIKPTYEGDGVTTGVTPTSLFTAIRVLLRNKNQVERRLKNNQYYKEKLLGIYKNLKKNVCADEKKWQELIFDDYLLSEGNYFEQIFINTVSQSIYKGELLKVLSKGDYLKLLMGLTDVSHLRPYKAIWDISRKKITNSEVSDFLDKFGYHSDKELDVSYPHYEEEPGRIRQMIRETAKLPNSESPTRHHDSQEKLFKEVYVGLSRKNQRTVDKMRNLLWWREEFRDISTMYYYLIRLYTIELAKKYKKENVIRNLDDIWLLKITDIRAFINGDLLKADLALKIDKNRLYYESFRNFRSEDEIGKRFNVSRVVRQKTRDGLLHGVGCSSGEVVGLARVVRDLSEIDKIKPGEILVTKDTDTGWTSKFAIIGGIVTEYGGVLCHAAIVSREFGIPCVVCAENAMTIINNGDKIRINGATGVIEKES